MRPALFRLLGFIFLGLLFAVPGEILNRILARQNVRAFAQTLLSYTILLFIGFFVGKGIRRCAKKQARAAVVTYVLFGSLGLMVEWFLLGNAPGLDPFEPITQPGMFTFWGPMLLAPWLLMESGEFSQLKIAFLRYFAAFSSLYLLVAMLLPRANGGIFIGFIIFALGSVGLNYYYLRYFKQLSSVQRRTST